MRAGARVRILHQYFVQKQTDFDLVFVIFPIFSKIVKTVKTGLIPNQIKSKIVKIWKSNFYNFFKLFFQLFPMFGKFHLFEMLWKFTTFPTKKSWCTIRNFFEIPTLFICLFLSENKFWFLILTFDFNFWILTFDFNFWF